MGVTTPAAPPSPYNEPVQTCRAGQGLAAAAGSRRVPLIHYKDASAGVLALVLQLRFEHAPACIEHGFRHACFCKFQAAHIADDYLLIFLNQAPREPMQGVFAPSGGLAVQPLCLPFVAAALGLGDLTLDTPLEMPCEEFLPIARGGRIFQPQIDTHRLQGSGSVRDGSLHRQTQPPISYCILGKAARLPLCIQ
jgi:hypothetical protein